MASSTSALRARALAKVNRLASTTSEYAAPRLQSAASTAAGKLAVLRDHYTSSSAAPSSSSTWAAEPGVLTTPKRAQKTRQVDFADLPVMTSARSPPASASEAKGSKWGGLGGYFSGYAGGGAGTGAGAMGSAGAPSGKGKQPTMQEPEEEKIVCFPGWAVLQPAPEVSSEPALTLDILCHGYSYRQRPLSQASRSQRIFYALAKSFASLPKIPPHLASAADAATAGLDAAALGSQSVDSLSSSLKEAALKDGNVFEQLLEVGGREGQGQALELADATVEAASPTTTEPEEMSLEEQLRSPSRVSPVTPITGLPHTANHTVNSRQGPHHAATAPLPSLPSTSSTPSASRSPEDEKILPTPAKLNRRPHVRIEIPARRAAGWSVSAMRSPSLPPTPSATSPEPRSPASRATGFFTKSHSRNSTKSSVPSSRASSRTSSRANSPTRAPASVPSAKSDPDAWPTPFAYTENDLPRLHANLSSRILPFFGAKLPGRKIRLSIYPVLGEGRLWDGALATKVVSTSAPGGGFCTMLQVRGKELKKLLEATAASGPGGGGGKGLDGLRVRVVAELLEPEGFQATETLPAGLGGGSVAGSASLRATAEDEVELGVAIEGPGGEGGGVRVISDVDDTIKWTEVLKGTKTIFRNVFVRELRDIRVPGMASWYRAMSSRGAHFHYVSNSPWELWPVVRAFMDSAGFPSGSCTLKEYGGAGSAIAKLWEEPGQRKRANVENILKEFPESQRPNELNRRFILVGDSGEQDMQLYVSLAAQYPNNVLAIYIRDVTTPFLPPASSSAAKAPSTSTSFAAKAATLSPPELKWQHSESASDLAGLVQEPEGADTRPFSEMPDLPGQFDGSHERPLGYIARQSHKPSRSMSAAVKSSAPPLPPRPSLGERANSSSVTMTPTASAPISPTSSLPASPHLSPTSYLIDTDDFDPLSPNNPLRPSPPPSIQNGTTTVAEQASVEAFYKRVAEAERMLPKGVKLRLFRHGKECAQEALDLLQAASKRRSGR
ncbi:SPOSA6832_04703 [Sporobolomyces salmonicolor]|uniref:SPOSA6832_04703-mRNA-1:cds n=1 Tax=Sporidiobolus salmonicolor TaxID=5005 RepID=A0A0D6ESP0_SPOSA|nr:SPOSA6832_04703 [Sporobolomyces salmonicolor]